jgi:hypothetical protein
MIRRTCTGLLAAAAALAASAGASGQVVISQVYGTGGVAAVYRAKYVELFNSGPTTASIGGWVVRHATLTGSPATWSTSTAIPAGTQLAPGQHYLIRMSSLGTAGLDFPLGTDHNAATSGSFFNNFGAIALVNGTITIPSNTCVVGQSYLVDYVNWRTTQNTTLNCVEVATILGTTDNAVALFRKGGGCTDTNNNPSDFEYAPAFPRNTAFNSFLASSFSPAVLDQNSGSSATLSVSLAATPCNSLSSIVSATADLTALGGGASTVMTNDGSGNFSVSVTPPAGQAIQTYFIPVTVSTISSGIISTRAVLRVQPAVPANDTCATAAPISAANGIVDNRGGSDDIDTGACGANTTTGAGVWYTYTPASTEILSFADSSLQDVTWGFFTGSCAGLTGVGCFTSEGTTASQTRFRLNAGTTYYMLVGNELGSAPTAELNLSTFLTPVSAPSNDACTGAELIAGFPFTGSVNAEGALDDPQIPTCVSTPSANAPTGARHGVWYQFSVPAAGLLLADETSSNSPAFAVWSGACGSLTPVACGGSSIAIPAGGTYFLQVYNNNAGLAPSGTWDLSIDFLPTPANDTCAGAQDIGSSFPLAINNIVYTAANDDADIECNSDSAALGRGLWYRFTATQNGRLSADVSRSTRTASAAWYSGCGLGVISCFGGTGTQTSFIDVTAGQTIYLNVGEWLRQSSGTITTVFNIDFTFAPAAANITCATAINLNSIGLPANLLQDQTPASDLERFPCTASGTQPARKALYYTFTPATDGRLRLADNQSVQNVDFRVYVAGNQADVCNTLTEVACISDANDRGSLTLEGGRTYVIIAADSGLNTTGVAGPYNLSFEFFPSPAGDRCSTATVIPSLPFSANVADIRNLGDDPDVDCNNASASNVWHGVWYSFTPATNMAISVSESTSTNVVTALYSGSCGSPALVCRSAEDGYYELTAGVNYWILVGYDSSSAFGPTATNAYQINIQQHDRFSNDLCADAVTVGTTTFNFTTNVTLATSDAPSGVSGTICNTSSATEMRNSIWFRLDVTGSGNLLGLINPDLGTASNGVWAIYPAGAGNACPVAGTAPLACGNDPEPIGVNVNLDPGVYYMQVGILGTATAPTAGITNVSLTFSGTLRPECVADFDGSGTPNIDDIFIFLNAWFANCTGQAGPPCNGRNADVNNNGLNIDDIFIFLNLWFAGC